MLAFVMPDLQLVYEAKRILRAPNVKASNVRAVLKCLRWYEHWCHVGDVSAAEVSEKALRNEVQKAQTLLEAVVQCRAQRSA